MRAEKGISLRLQVERVERALSIPPIGRPQVLALTIFVVVAALLVFMGVTDAFYVYAEDVRITGVKYTLPEEVYEASGLEGHHVFYVHPEEVAHRVERLPFVRRARVRIMVPANVSIRVEERIPILVWQRQDGTFWVDADGRVLPPKGEVTGLLRVVDPQGLAAVAPEDPGGEETFDTYLLQALREIHEIFPSVNTVLYDRSTGLRLVVRTDQGDIQVYLGGYIGLERRLEYLPRVLRQIRRQGTWYRFVDLSDLDHIVLEP